VATPSGPVGAIERPRYAIRDPRRRYASFERLRKNSDRVGSLGDVSLFNAAFEIYLNDAVSALPGYQPLYDDNKGCISFFVKTVK
jgi:hypothetical protein